MPAAPPVLLSDRQTEVLKWAAAGKSRGVTADIMNISEAAVDDHFRRIFKKLNCNDKVVAVLRAMSSGIIHL
ncbi:response regulator transcription factor [Segnochrobactrum spirostomi]|nr:helix-turn-helix transcriptional regulator [Segnochrobactrum spirostomi]